MTNQIVASGEATKKALRKVREAKENKEEVKASISYRGAIELIRRSGQVNSLSAHEVYKGDKFEYAYGLEEKLIHIPCGDGEEKDITHFYACYRLKDGESGFVVLSNKQVERYRVQSTTDGNIEDYISYGLKIVLLKLAKYMPLQVEEGRGKKLDIDTLDNTVMKVNELCKIFGFGDGFIDTNCVVNCNEV